MPSNERDYDNHGFPFAERLEAPTVNNIGDKNVKFTEWIRKLNLYAKTFAKRFYPIFDEQFRSIPLLWTDIKYHYTQDEVEDAKEDRDGPTSMILKSKISQGMELIKDWIDIQPKLTTYIILAMTEAAIKRAEERDRDAWRTIVDANDILGLLDLIRKSQIESGKATTLKDRNDARKARYEIKLKQGERFEDFVKRIADADFVCKLAKVTIPDDELRFSFLQEMIQFNNTAVYMQASNYLQLLVIESEQIDTIERPKQINPLIKDIPTMIEAFRATLIVHCKTDQQFSNKFTVNHMKSETSSDHKTKEQTEFANGQKGFLTDDNLHADILQFDAKGNYTGVKRFKTKKNKFGKIGLKPFNADSVPNIKKEANAINNKNDRKKNSDQLNIEKLMKDKDISYSEAKKLYGPCNFCNLEGHHEKNCRKKGKQSSSDKNSSTDNKKDNSNKSNKSSSYYTHLTDDDSDEGCVYSFSTTDNYVFQHENNEEYKTNVQDTGYLTSEEENDDMTEIVNDSINHDEEYQDDEDDNISPSMEFIASKYNITEEVSTEEYYSTVMHIKSKDFKYVNSESQSVEYNSCSSVDVSCFLSDQELKDQNSFNLLLLDSAANICACCNPALIPNIRELEKKFIVTHFGGQTTVTHGGDHPILGKCLMNNILKINILALCALEDAGYDEFTAKDKSRKIFTHPVTKHMIIFNKYSDKMYKCSVSLFIDSMKDLYFSQVKECYGVNEGESAYHMYNYIATYYTMDQQRRAQEAIRLHAALNHPSDAVLKGFLVSPSAINGSLTPQDLDNARDMYGPCQNCLEGKPISHQNSHSGFDPSNTSQQPGQILHADIVYIGEKEPVLMSCDDFTNYGNISHMDSKSSNECIKALDYHIATYQANLKVVQMIITDSEHNLTSKEVEIHLAAKGIKQCQSIPKEHAKVIERYVRVVREKMNAKISELPFVLPQKHYFYLADDVIKKNNILPNAKTSPRTPHEMVEGVKFNFYRDLQAVFGAAVVVSHARQTANSNSPQEIGVCMGTAKRVPGSILVLCPSDPQDVPKPRRAVHSAIMTKDIIDWMNRKAAEKPIGDNTPVIRTTQLPVPYSEHGNPAPNPADDLIQPTEVITDNISNDYYVPYNEPMDNSQPESAPAPLQMNVPIQEVLQPTIVTPAVDTPSIVVKDVKPKSKVEEAIGTRRSARQADENYKHKAVVSKAGINITELHAYLTNISVNDVEHCNIMAADSYTFQQAMASERRVEAKAACKGELKGLMDQKSWRYLRNISEREKSVHNVITVPMLLVGFKYNAKGEFTKCKGRMVSGGHTTDPNMYDPLEKHSPTVPIEVANIQLGLASFSKAQVETLDIPMAYINAKLKEGRLQVMRIPKHIANLILEIDPSKNEFLQKDGTMLVEVIRALYGFPESAKLWNELITDTLKKGGYKQCPVEPCLFRKHIDVNQWSILTIFVDDCLHIFKGNKMKTDLLHLLKNAKLPTPTMQELSMHSDISYLGINIERKASNEFTLSQPGFVEDILAKHPPEREYRTPHTEHLFNRPADEDKRLLPCITQFLSLLMKLMFLATRTRPDILLAVCSLATKSKEPTFADAAHLDRVVGYLKLTKHLKLVCKVTKLVLKGLFDAAHAVYPDMKGVNGILILLDEFPLVCKSSKQKSVHTSSTTSELSCVFTGSDLLLYIRRLCAFLGIMSENDTVDIYQDNTSAIKMSYMGRGSSQSKSKFIDIKYFWLKEHLDNKVFAMKYLQRDNMIADFFASPRIGKTFSGWRDIILGIKK